MNDMMKQLVPALVIAVFCALIIPDLASFGRTFEITAVVGWVLLLIWVMHRAMLLPAPIARLIDRLSPSRRVAAMKAAEREAQRQKLATAVSAERVQAALDDWLIGQNVLTVDVGRAVESFAGKKNPGKPLSILVAGPSGSGRTSFAEGLSATLAGYGAGRLLRIDCASDSDIDFADVGAKLADLSLPVLLLDNIDRIGDQRQAGRVVTELMRLIDAGIVAGKPLLRRCVVLMTMLVDHAITEDVHRQAADKPDELHLLMRHAVRATRRIPEDLVDRVELVEVMKPLADLEQVAIVWKIFCSMALQEHEITIVEDALGLGDGIEDFLIGARERWLKAGVSGAREAARYVARAADGPLIAAARAGHTRVRARWDRQTAQIRLDPVDADDAVSPKAPGDGIARDTPPRPSADGAPQPELDGPAAPMEAAAISSRTGERG
jgi:hypothetical protein